MSSIIRIKRSATSGNPTTLAAGEFAYSYLPDNGSNGGDRLYVGTGTEISGDAVNHTIIGGKYFTDMLDHAKGVLTANSALVTDVNKKLDEIIVDNININGNTIETTAGNLSIISAGGEVDFNDVNLHGVATPIHGGDAVNKDYADQLATQFLVHYAVDNGDSASYVPFTEHLTYVGGTGLSTTINPATDELTFTLDDTVVTPGSYGSQTAIPTFTVDQQGRLTNAGSVNVATNLTINGDPVSLLDSDITIAVSGNLGLTHNTDTNTLTVDLPNAGIAVKGAASFQDSDFTISTGHIEIEDKFINKVVTESGSVVPVNHAITIQGNTIQGTSTSATGDILSVTVADATSGQKGVASFIADDFVANNGDISLVGAVLKSITTDDGIVGVTNHALSILGGEGIDVNHAGTNIIVNGEDATTVNKGIASFDTNAFNVSSGAVTIKTGGVSNDDIANSHTIIGDTSVDLGATITDITGLTGATIDDIRIDGNVISTSTSQPDLILDPKGGDSASGRVVIYGDLQVNGTQTIINSTSVSINDLTLTLADEAADSASSNGAGIIVDGSNAEILYSHGTNSWVSNRQINVPELLINGININEHVEDHLGNNFFAVGEGLDITYGSGQDSDNTIIFSAELATYTNNGVASFDASQFSVVSGYTTITVLDGGTY